jgi:LysR family transcriptional activator of nhaA
VKREATTDWHSYLLEQQPVALVGKKLRGKKKFNYPECLHDTPLLLPTLDSNLRVSFDLVMESQGVVPVIAAEIDDMAMMRLLAREGAGVALVPPVVVTGELERGQLVELHRFPDIYESFYAIAPGRKFPNVLVQEMIQSQRGD